MNTLYHRLRTAEELPDINLEVVHRALFREYEENPVLRDAIAKKKTIEDTLSELAEKNKGLRKIIPWKKDKAHNERLNNLGELVDYPIHLETAGVWYIDNFITTTIGASALFFAAGYGFTRLIVPHIYTDPQVAENAMFVSQFAIPAFMSCTVAPLLGLLLNSRRFTSKLPEEASKYLDEKIKEFY